MFRWVWLCFVCLCCFGYVLIVSYVLCIISMILYYIKDIAYDLIYFYQLTPPVTVQLCYIYKENSLSSYTEHIA